MPVLAKPLTVVNVEQYLLAIIDATARKPFVVHNYDESGEGVVCGFHKALADSGEPQFGRRAEPHFSTFKASMHSGDHKSSVSKEA